MELIYNKIGNVQMQELLDIADFCLCDGLVSANHLPVAY